MKKSTKLIALIATLCLGISTSIGLALAPTSTVKAEDATVETVVLGDLPQAMIDSSYGYMSKTNADYVIKAGLFDATAENYGLNAFDNGGKDGDAPYVTCSAATGLKAMNWKWEFGANTSVVIEVKAKIDGTVKFDFAKATTLSGWMDAWNTVFSLYRKNAADGTLTTIHDYVNENDAVAENKVTKPSGELNGTSSDEVRASWIAMLTQTVEVKAGDIVYYEIGAVSGRNLQNMHTAEIVVAPEEVEEILPVEQTYNVKDLPYHTWYSEFGYYNAGNVQYVMKAGQFNAAAENYGLTAFDTKNSDNNISSTLYPSMTIENWKWTFTGGGTVVIEVKSNINGIIKFDMSTVTGGWMDAWPTVFSLHRKNVDGTLDKIANYFEGTDSVSGSSTPSAGANMATLLTQEVKVATGDIIYYEVGTHAGSANAYNLQGVIDAKIIATPIFDDPVVNKVSELTPSWTAAYEALNEKHYTAENWAKVEEIYASFAREAKDCADADAVQALYDAKLAELKAVATDPILVAKEEKSTAITALYSAKKESDFTAENWAIYKGAYDAFVAGVEACETVDAVNALYDAKVAEMAAVKAYKQGHHYLDYPSTMNANGYSWITGDVYDTKLYAGTVANLKEFDSGSGHKMYNAELNTGFDNPAYYAENWKWYIGRDAGVIVAFKANQNCVITITNTRVASGQGGQGWTSDCTLTYYILREGVTKEIYQVNAPSADEQFSGDWHLKAGDVLYVEFASSIINDGEVRNTEGPCNTAVTADSTTFDADKYAEQNHDLPAEVVAHIAEKLEALNAHVATLKEEDYSATNWLNIADLVAQFVEKCEKEVETIADVDAAYDAAMSAINATPTKAQAAAELKAALDGYVAELQAEYDKLTQENYYNEENKAKLDKALADGKTSIETAKSKSAGNTAKSNAIAALRAVETSEAPKDSCFGGIASSAMLSVLAMLGVCIIAKKKNR